MWRQRNKYPIFHDYAAKVTAHSQYCGGYRMQERVPTRSDMPLVSIVTVTYNAQSTLMRTLESVRTQTYPNIEHIIIDGGSTDGTIDIIRAYEDVIAYWRSEPDQGIYDAFNKGVVLSKGKYVGILNADDYYETDQIEMAVATLERTKAPFVHGNIVMHGWKGQDICLNGDPDYVSKIGYAMPMLLHVTMLCDIDLFKKCGLFSTRYRIAGDYEWFLRITKQGFLGAYDPMIRSHMQAGGISTSNQRRSMLEGGHIVWQHGLPMYQAIISTIPRVLFPNGHEHIIPRLLDHVKNPKPALRRYVDIIKTKYFAHRKKQSQCTFPLDVFLNARQICSSISPNGLEWLYTLAGSAVTYAIRSSFGAELSAVKTILEGGGARQVPSTESAHIIVTDSDHIQGINLDRWVHAKTVLLICPDNAGFDLKNIPHVYFGGIAALGNHVKSKTVSEKGA